MMPPDDSAAAFGPDDPLGDDPLAAEPLAATHQAAARRYHEPPPPVPADAMWAAIQARRARAPSTTAGDGEVARAIAVAEPATLAVGVAHRPRGRGRQQHRGWRRATLAAAVLLVAVGVEIGRQPAATDSVPQAIATAARSDGRSLPAPAGVAESDDTPRPRGAAVEPPRRAAAERTVAATSARVPARVPGQSRVGSAGGAGDDAADGGTPAAVAGFASAPLRAATQQHLARAEVLLATFAGHESGGAAPDSAWARDLLTTTRLLLDSPAGRDPTRRALLEDLELVLAQIARLPRADTPVERTLIDQAIRRGDLLSKLHTAVPAGAPVATAVHGT